MTKWAHADVLDNGINYIKTNCNKVILVNAYTANDTYATVTGGTVLLAEATMASGDFALAGASGAARTLTTTSKSDTAANLTGTASHVCFVDTVASKVLWVTNETTGQSITLGNPVTFPSLVYTVSQPN